MSEGNIMNSTSVANPTSNGQAVVAQMSEARLTDEMIEAMRERIGAELRIDHSTNNDVATALSVARFTGGIGDTNELWVDPAVAEASAYQAPVAPPSWVICCFAGLQFGWPGLGSFHASSDLTFHQPVFIGDVIRPTCVYQGFDGPRSSSFAGQTVTDHFLNTYRNQRGEVVAEIHWTVFNYERSQAKARSGRPNGDPVQLPHPWTAEEVAVLEQQIASERPRGREPRFWEDVEVGEPLCEIIKGPIGTTDEVAYVAAGGAPIRRLAAHRHSLLDYRRQPDWAFRDPVTSALEPIYSVHYNEHAAQAMGVAMQYDVGFQRQCWQIHLLCDWMGDDGWIKDASAQYRSFVYLSDAVRLGGQVVGKRVDEDGEHVVDVRTRAVNQRGADVMPGTATIALATRRGDHPVERRRPVLRNQAADNEPRHGG
jgi:acyl dehydratase